MKLHEREAIRQELKHEQLPRLKQMHGELFDQLATMRAEGTAHTPEGREVSQRMRAVASAMEMRQR